MKLKNAVKILLQTLPVGARRAFCVVLLLTLLNALTELLLALTVGFLAVVFSSPAEALAYIPPLLHQTSLYTTFSNEPRLFVLAALLCVTGAVVVKSFFAVLLNWQSVGFSEMVAASARQTLFSFFVRAPYLWTLNKGSAALLFGLNSAMQLGQALTYLLIFSSSLLLCLFMLGGMLYIAPLATLVLTVVLGGGGALIMKLVQSALHKRALRIYHADQAAHTIQIMGVNALKEMRLALRGEKLTREYNERMQEVRAARKSQGLFQRLPVTLLETQGFIVLTLVLCVLVFIQDASMARITGVLGFLAAAAWRMLPVMNRAMDGLTNLQTLLPYLMHTAKFLQEAERLSGHLIPLRKESSSPLPFEHCMELQDVSFTYPDKQVPVLDHVNLTIRRGEMIGIIGFSGAGKSTLANVLTGLLPWDDGKVLIDGTPLAGNNISSWLGKIGYVSQSPYILDASLAENVALGDWGGVIDRDRVKECCRLAAITFLDDLPKGLDTVLGERGTRLSGGQAQRVAIARALYTNPELIIFDEATSSLDLMNEKAIHDTILSLRDTVTMVIIAHRLSTVEGCDSLVWLDKGRVRMAGSSATVLPAYNNVFKTQ